MTGRRIRRISQPVDPSLHAFAGESSRTETDHEGLTRRRLLELAARAGGVALAAPLVDPLAARALPPRWPAGQLPSRAARRIDPSQFLPQSQLLVWQQQLDGMGLRATASPVHERYVDLLRDRLERAGVRQLRFEQVPLDRWTTDAWSLRILDGPSAGAIGTASYIPYSGRTRAGGVTGPLTLVDSTSAPAPGSLRGKIAVFDVELVSYTYQTFLAISYKAYDPGHVFVPNGTYARPWLGIGDEITSCLYGCA